jgi:hypothetical protein
MLVITKYHFNRHVWDAIAAPPLLVKARQVTFPSVHKLVDMPY